MGINDTLVIGINHLKDPASADGGKLTRKRALDAYANDGYRFAGRIELNVWQCAPDRALNLAWAETQHREKPWNGHRPWRVGERSSLPGDIFAIGRELHLVGMHKFTMLEDKHEPRVAQALVLTQRRRGHGCALKLFVTFDNGQTRAHDVFSHDRTPVYANGAKPGVVVVAARGEHHHIFAAANRR